MADPSYVTSAGRANLIIGAYKDYTFGTSALQGNITAFVDHSSISIKDEIVYTQNDAAGQASPSLVFSKMGPRTFSAKLIFDTTGLLSGTAPSSVTSVNSEVEDFKTLCLDYNGTVHRPNFLWLFWGTDDFQGVLTDLQVEYKMYSAQGYPLRAEVTITVKDTVDPEVAATEAEAESPDMTHTRKVNKSSSLSEMSYQIYGDPGYYLSVARANDLDQFRQLKPGTFIDFPPLD